MVSSSSEDISVRELDETVAIGGGRQAGKGFIGDENQEEWVSVAGIGWTICDEHWVEGQLCDCSDGNGGKLKNWGLIGGGKNWVPVTVMGRTDEHWVKGGHLCDCSDGGGGKLKNWGLIGRGGENWNFCRG